MTTPSTARKAGPYTGTGAQTSWPFGFKTFVASDIRVTAADANGVERTLVLNVDYGVALNANQESSPGGTVTYLLPSGHRLSITGAIAYDQPLDLPSGGNFNPVALENQLDRSTMQIQQLAEGLARAVKVPVTEEGDGQLNDDLARGILRLMGSADNVDTVADNITNVNAVAGNVADVNTVASNIGNVAATGANIAAVVTVANDLNEPVSEIDTVATNIANVNTVGQSIGTVNTVASNIADVNTVVTNIADVQTVATNVADVTNFADVYYGPRASDPTTRNDGSPPQLGDVYFNTGSKRQRTFDGAAWVEGSTIPGTYTVDVFSGDGTETAFPLSVDPVSKNNTQVFIDGVYQQKSQYSVAGASITFTAAPPAGTNNIEVAVTTTASLGTVDSAFVPYASTTVRSAMEKAVLAYPDFASAQAGSALLPDGQTVEVSQDESLAGARTRYKVQAGALVFAANLEQTSDGALKLAGLKQPQGTPSVAVNPAAGNLNGLTYYTCTYVSQLGETEVSPLSAGVAPAGQQVNLSNIPVSPDASVTARRIYRTKANGGDTVLGFLVATINDNTTTNYTDNVPDASLGVPGPRIGSAGGVIYKNGLRIASTDGTTTTFGQNCHPANTGYANTAFGTNVMTANTTGYRNCAFGIFALYANTTGARNSAFGVHAMNDSTTANDGTALGYAAGMHLTTAIASTAIGSNALNTCTTGGKNTAVGASAMVLTSTGSDNTAVGADAMFQNATGIQNTALGSGALKSNIIGNFNVGIGMVSAANVTGSGNTAIGTYALETAAGASGNVALGFQAGRYETGSNKLFIDNQGRANEADARLKALIYGVFGSSTGNQSLRFNGSVAVDGQFGCNGNAAQPKVGVNAAATDLPTALALLNQLRAALIANGICI